MWLCEHPLPFVKNAASSSLTAARETAAKQVGRATRTAAMGPVNQNLYDAQRLGHRALGGKGALSFTPRDAESTTTNLKKSNDVR